MIVFKGIYRIRDLMILLVSAVGDHPYFMVTCDLCAAVVLP